MSANDRQEGGSHYKQNGDRPEHWDLSILYAWDPFQYQITKYVMRWKDKYDIPSKRLEDLKKARHFLDKYIENWEVYDDHKPSRTGNTTSGETKTQVLTAEVLNTFLQPLHVDQNWTIEGYLGSGNNVYQCRHCKHEERVAGLEQAYTNHPNCSLAHSHFATP